MFGDAINELAVRSTVDALNSMTAPDQAKVSTALVNWLTFKARKRPGFEELLGKMSARIETMSSCLVFSTDGRRVEVSARGDSGDTLAELARGSSWFDGHPDIAREIVNAVFNKHEDD